MSAATFRDGIFSTIRPRSEWPRVRYEIEREFAPYVGVVWTRQFGDTADLTRDAGGDVEELSFVFGVRMWF